MALVSPVLSKNQPAVVVLVHLQHKANWDFSMLPPGGGAIWLRLSDINLH